MIFRQNIFERCILCLSLQTQKARASNATASIAELAQFVEQLIRPKLDKEWVRGLSRRQKHFAELAQLVEQLIRNE